MAHISREITAPIAPGDALDANEIENEITTIHGAINGGLDESNLSASTAIPGSKIAADLTESNVTGGALTLASMNASATITSAISSVDGVDTDLGTSTSWANLPLVSAASLTPGNSTDMIVMDATMTVRRNSLLSSIAGYELGFAIDGSEVDATPLARLDLVGAAEELVHEVCIHWTWMEVSGGTSSVSIIPRVRASSAGGVSGILPDGVLVVFRAFVLPMK